MGNDTETHYSYTADTRRLDALETHSPQTGRTFQQLSYTYDLVGNIVAQANAAQNTQNNLLGGATSYTYQYDDLYRLIGATGSWEAPNNPESFTLSMGYDTIHNITNKTQSHLVTDREQKKTSYDWTYGYNGGASTAGGTSTASTQPHAPTDIGDRTFSYDANGNQTGWSHNQNGTNRTIVWDEENRIQSVADNGATTTYKYNDAGERVFKVGAQGETVYVNQFYVIRGGQVATKHIFGGASRLVTKLASQPVDAPSTSTAGADTSVSGDPTTAAAGGNGNGQGAGNANGGGAGNGSGATGGGNNNAHGNNPNAGGANGAANGQGSGAGGVNGGGASGGNGNGNGGGNPGGGNNNGGGAGDGSGATGGGAQNAPQEERIFYFYHPDHLGSSSYVTDIDGEVFQHVEYFPFGETWVEEHSNRQRTPYLFTGKELDEDTQLYYFGARYYDPRTSVWQSPDPILAEYLPKPDQIPEVVLPNLLNEYSAPRYDLPSLGGVYASSNLNLYGYVQQKPVSYFDPDGEQVFPRDDGRFMIILYPQDTANHVDRRHGRLGTASNRFTRDLGKDTGQIMAMRGIETARAKGTFIQEGDVTTYEARLGGFMSNVGSQGEDNVRVVTMPLNLLADPAKLKSVLAEFENPELQAYIAALLASSEASLEDLEIHVVITQYPVFDSQRKIPD